MSRSRGCAISTSSGCAVVGIRCSAAYRRFTCLAICCSVPWFTGCRSIIGVTWIAQSRRLLDRSGSPEQAGRSAVDLSRRTAEIRPGTILSREWNGQIQQVAVLAEGFAWNGNTYPSLSQVAFAITGTRWNGPRFFGLRDKPLKGSSP